MIPVDTQIRSLLQFMVCLITVILVLFEMHADISNLSCGAAQIIPQHGTTFDVFTSGGNPFKRLLVFMIFFCDIIYIVIKDLSMMYRAL